jgi:hypothetical protein
MSPCQAKFDKEKSKHAGLVQQNWAIFTVAGKWPP